MVLRKIVDLVNDKERFKKLTKTMKIQGEFIYVDYSKTHVNSDFLENKVADIGNLLKKKQEMFKRENVKFTENKSVLNTHCRDKNIIVKLLEEDKQCDLINEDDISICFTLRQMKTFCRDFIDGKLTGATGKVLRTIVNIGIGGSDWGPRMVTAALEFYKKGNSSVHFISNIDPTEFNQVFEKIKVEETLFVVVSKSFTTAETLHNAKLAREKICKKLSISDNDASKHFVAATANSSEAEKFGVYRVFKILEEVNGRFSLWTACGLSIALYIGIENFLDLLLGASLMDQHFYSAEPKENIPIIHALVEDYYNNGDEIENYDNICILPYDVYLKLLPAYLQQAEMES
ncbi:putative glucose-6-phosphate isomerase, partial [Dictyocoela roeselum]